MPPFHRRPPSASVAPALPLLALLAGCGDAARGRGTPAAVDSADASMAVIAPARYLTHLLFAGGDGTVFFASFAQETDAERLSRDYAAWWGDAGGWRPLSRVRDTLPVPRAAWRILPTPDMAVRVGDSREVHGLDFRSGEARVALVADERVSAWTGPTGQRESLGLAGLAIGERSVGGVLYFRRAARATRFPAESGVSRTFVLADSAGNGLLIEVGEGPEQPVVARTWLHGTAAVWDGVTFEPDDGVGATPVRRWTFRIAAAGLNGVIRAVSSRTEGPVPAFRIECDVIADGASFRFTGAAASLPLP